MTANQCSVHPATVLIPAPRFKLGQHVAWTDESKKVHSFTGIVIEQTYRMDYEISNWEYTLAITTARVDGKGVDWYAGDNHFDVDESLITNDPMFSRMTLNG